MLKNYLLTAWRHLFKQRGYALINLAGLAVGFASFIVIALYVRYELSFDHYHDNADRIYRVSSELHAANGLEASRSASQGGPFAPLFAGDFPQVEKVGRILDCGGSQFGSMLVNGDVGYFDLDFAMADNEIFEIFDFEWLYGDRSAALTAPGTIVLTESAAIKYFGRTDAVGETLLQEGGYPVEVTGVIGDLPDNTHLNFGVIGSVLNQAPFNPVALNYWGLPCYHTYALMREDADLAAIEAQSDEFFERHRGEGSSERNGYFLQALADLHLGPPLEREVKPSGSMTAVLSFSAIAVFILILACINFVNLATARASLRAREIGVRKSVGASRAELFGQFIGESVLIAALAAIAAVGLAALALPVFGNFVRQPLGAGALAEPAVIAFIAASAILVGLAAGAYPSLFLSGFRPVRVLRGDITRGKAAGLLRKCLVIGQFAISVALIVAAIVVYQQMRYAQTLDLGYGQDQVVLLSTAPTLGILRQWDPMREALIAHPEIVDASVSQQTPGNAIGRIAQVSAGTDEPVNLPALWVEFGFFETYGIEMAAGRPFSEAFGIDRVVRTDSTATASFVISELAARRLGADSPEDMVGRPITVDNIDGTVVGVARDIHFESLREVITPLVYAIDVRQENSLIPHRYGSIRITGNDLAGTLEHIDTTWREFEPDQPIARRFLDQDFQALYEAEERQGNMLLGFSLLAIFIACLGLFGLATFAIEQRRKEIGIRKAVGGTVFDIVRIFLTEFASLVLLASLIAWPVAYFAIVPWLENFAYRIDLGLLPFAGATAAALLVACLTVGAAALRAAMAKPIHALRYE